MVLLRLCVKSTIAELRTFIREQNGKMHGSPHDDRVMSLAIANQMLEVCLVARVSFKGSS
jgi:hypothetical protein